MNKQPLVETNISDKKYVRKAILSQILDRNTVNILMTSWNIKMGKKQE